LEELSDDHCIHPELGEVLNLLDPTRCEDEDEEEEEEDGEEGEEEYKNEHEEEEYEEWDEWANDRIH
jgi:hypothetical protein